MPLRVNGSVAYAELLNRDLSVTATILNPGTVVIVDEPRDLLESEGIEYLWVRVNVGDSESTGYVNYAHLEPIT